MKAAAATLLLAILLVGCASRPPSADIERPVASHRQRAGPPPDQALFKGDRDQIVMTAFAQVGKPYLYGGNGPDAFDCSGLVRYAYGAGGARTPRTTATLYTSGRAIAVEDAKPGDLMFYRLDSNRSGPSHVVFYLGDQQGIHAPSSGGAIRAVRLDIPYFSLRFLGARRLLE
ncbi:MAG: C40 family peptidase [Pseudomonadota bacterium]